jgi:dCMP deaminase
MAHVIAGRSYDRRLQVGALVVPADNTAVLAIGYNGNYKGGPHVPDSEEPGKSGYIHAETNALVKCDFSFPKLKHMYITHSPCLMCSKLIINADITRVVYDQLYRDPAPIELLRSTGVEVLCLLDAVELEFL